MFLVLIIIWSQTPIAALNASLAATVIGPAFSSILGWCIANWSLKVRRLQTAPLARPTPGQTRSGSAGGSLRSRELGWGYDRIVGALANLGHQVSDQTVGNILRRHGIGPVLENSTTTT